MSMARSLPPLSEIDPRGLIAEAYRIEGIGLPECRSIFLDWAIGLPADTEAAVLVPALLAHCGSSAPDHPMTRVLREGLGTARPPARRGGYKARRR